MLRFNIRSMPLILLLLTALLLSACTAGDAQFTQETPAGFWYGIWHGMISVIALIVHFFNDKVGAYEIHNIGGWYDCGFLFGVILVWSSGSHVNCKTAKRKQRDKEWDEIGAKVEKKLKRKIREWAEKD